MCITLTYSYLNIILRLYYNSYALVSADYSQIEVRILAHIAADPALLQLFRAEGDVYVNMASLIFKKPADAIVPSERNRAKVICLGE